MSSTPCLCQQGGNPFAHSTLHLYVHSASEGSSRKGTILFVRYWNSFGWEYKLRSSLCMLAFHRTDSKHTDTDDQDGSMPATKKHSTCTVYENMEKKTKNKNGTWLPLRFDKKRSRTPKNLFRNGERQRLARNTGGKVRFSLAQQRRVGRWASLWWTEAWP